MAHARTQRRPLGAATQFLDHTDQPQNYLTYGEYTLHTTVEREDETLTATVETLAYDPSSVPSTGDLDYDGTATVAFNHSSTR